MANKYLILLVEDESNIASFITTVLRANQYEVKRAATGEEALMMASSYCPDLIILDLGLPDIDGQKVLSTVRSWTQTPVIVVSARSHERDKVESLDLGADDYITKPFRIKELQSRIRSVMRRYQKQEDDGIAKIRDIIINTKTGKVYKNNTEILLTALEYRLLLVFLNHQGQILSRSQILEGIWDVAGNYVNDNTLSVYIKRLREKLEDDPGDPLIIVTVRGLGYRMEKNNVA